MTIRRWICTTAEGDYGCQCRKCRRLRIEAKAAAAREAFEQQRKTEEAAAAERARLDAANTMASRDAAEIALARVARVERAGGIAYNPAAYDGWNWGDIIEGAKRLAYGVCLTALVSVAVWAAHTWHLLIILAPWLVKLGGVVCKEIGDDIAMQNQARAHDREFYAKALAWFRHPEDDEASSLCVT
jgi:hypothetical protein